MAVFFCCLRKNAGRNGEGSLRKENPPHFFPYPAAINISQKIVRLPCISGNYVLYTGHIFAIIHAGIIAEGRGKSGFSALFLLPERENMESIENWIVYEDEAVIVCHKRAGMAVQSARITEVDMESALKTYLSQKSGGGGPVYLGIINRLDQNVEGLVLFAKTPKAAAELTRIMQEGKMVKEYLAVVAEGPKEEEGRLCDTLLKDPRANMSRVVEKGHPGGKEARLSYKVLERGQSGTLLRIVLETGRHHQIRVQLSHAGMPILGDAKYGAGAQEYRGPIALCAFRLTIRKKGKKPEIFALVPEGEAFQPFARRIANEEAAPE